MRYQVIAGVLSATLFVSGYIPMLLKVARTRDLHSYSFTQILINNVGNFIYWIYVSSLPVGPIWLLHGFYTVAMMLMLFWYLRYERNRSVAGPMLGRQDADSGIT